MSGYLITTCMLLFKIAKIIQNQLKPYTDESTGSGKIYSDSVWKMFVVKCTGHHIS